MGYCEDDSVVRLDIYKRSGKWYETVALNMRGLYDHMWPSEAVKVAIERQLHYKIGQWNFVVAEPYHVNSYPVMLVAED